MILDVSNYKPNFLTTELVKNLHALSNITILTQYYDQMPPVFFIILYYNVFINYISIINFEVNCFAFYVPQRGV